MVVMPQQPIHGLIKAEQPRKLMRIVSDHRQNMPKGIAYSLIDYREWVDTTGRCIRENKTGQIAHNNSPILEPLGITSEQWLTLTTEFEQHFHTAIGSEHMLQQFKHHTDHQRIRGMAKARVWLHAWKIQYHTPSNAICITSAQWRHPCCIDFTGLE